MSLFYVLVWWLIVFAAITPWTLLVLEWLDCQDYGLNVTFPFYCIYCARLQTALAAWTTLLAIAVLVFH